MLKKTQLLEAIAGKNRGLLATEVDQRAILSALAQLEDYNPNPRPLEVPHLLEGDWRLLYTSSKALLNLDKFPFLELGQIYQCIRLEGTRIYNIAELSGLPYLETLVSVAAKFTPVSDFSGTVRRVEVQFERSIIGLQRSLGYQSPGDFIRNLEMGKKFTPLDFTLDITIPSREQQGWLDITYLDEDLRLGRGNEGSVFVLTKN
jgi:hypothetical protein